MTFNFYFSNSTFYTLVQNPNFCLKKFFVKNLPSANSDIWIFTLKICSTNKTIKSMKYLNFRAKNQIKYLNFSIMASKIQIFLLEFMNKKWFFAPVWNIWIFMLKHSGRSARLPCLFPAKFEFISPIVLFTSLICTASSNRGKPPVNTK